VNRTAESAVSTTRMQRDNLQQAIYVDFFCLFFARFSKEMPEKMHASWKFKLSSFFLHPVTVPKFCFLFCV